MKIKVAVLEKDSNYLKRISVMFENKYAEEVQIFSFTDVDIAIESLKTNKIDVFLANYDLKSEINKVKACIPKRCGLAYLGESGETFVNDEDERVIGKFQKNSLIYKEILSIYSEVAEFVSGNNADSNQRTRLIYVTSPVGGVGKTSVAIAFAKHMSAIGKKVLYLDLNSFSEVSLFLGASGQFNFSELIFAIKSQKSNLGIKLESTVSQDASGVYFYPQASTAMDVEELNEQDVATLLNTIMKEDKYDYVVVDKDFYMSSIVSTILKTSNSVVLVSDGNAVSNGKILRAYKTLEIMDNNGDFSLNKLNLIYNKFSNKSGRVIEGLDINEMGGISKYESPDSLAIINEIQKMQVFEAIK